jgi:CHAT domain-containing protein
VVALPTGLLQAGVGGVIASLWRVPEMPTTRLVTEFYRRWQWEKVPVPMALREAQQWLRDTPNGKKVAEYRQAQKAGADWLAPEAAAAVTAQLAFRDPDERADEGLTAWAAFAYVGA